MMAVCQYIYILLLLVIKSFIVLLIQSEPILCTIYRCFDYEISFFPGCLVQFSLRSAPLQKNWSACIRRWGTYEVAWKFEGDMALSVEGHVGWKR